MTSLGIDAPANFGLVVHQFVAEAAWNPFLTLQTKMALTDSHDVRKGCEFRKIWAPLVAREPICCLA